MKRKKSFLKKITLLFVLFFLIHVGHGIIEHENYNKAKSDDIEYLGK